MDKSAQDVIVRKVFVRLLPVLVIAYLAGYLDRVNIANAALTMNADIYLSVSTFGLGSGLFFVTYFFFGPPSNLVLQRLGIRLWMVPTVVVLGLLTMAMAFVRGPVSFVIIRLLLGIAEAGFFPGVVLYLTYWFPATHRSRVTAAFMIAIPLSLAIAGPVTNLILHLSGLCNFKGWQWLFLLEGAATIVVAALMFLFLPDRPDVVAWLDDAEKRWLTEELIREAAAIRITQVGSAWRVLTNRRVLLLAYIYLANITTNLGIAFFLPLILKSMGATVREANYISAIPYIAGVGGILLFGVLADRYREHRVGILIISLAIAALGLAGAGLVSANVVASTLGVGRLGLAFLSILFVTLSAIGIYGTKAPFWPLPSLFLTGSAAAVGIGFINSVGNLGGFFGPYIVSWVQTTTNSYYMAFGALAAVAVSAALAACFVGASVPAGGGGARDEWISEREESAYEV